DDVIDEHFENEVSKPAFSRVVIRHATLLDQFVVDKIVKYAFRAFGGKRELESRMSDQRPFVANVPATECLHLAALEIVNLGQMCLWKVPRMLCSLRRHGFSTT